VLLLLDPHLPPPDGLILLPQLRQQWSDLRVLTSTLATPEVVRVAAAGAQGSCRSVGRCRAAAGGPSER
jgi:DNA-binding response OmpR family regulator